MENQRPSKQNQVQALFTALDLVRNSDFKGSSAKAIADVQGIVEQVVAAMQSELQEEAEALKKKNKKA